jgi:cell division septation protein DedD
VRPDGTLIASGYESAQVPFGTTPASAQPEPKRAEAALATDVEASTPAVALPTKLAPPKSAARVVNKLDTTAPADPGAGPVPVKPKKPKPIPTPVAEAEPKTDDATAPAASGGGGYAVQLAAPKSESEAKALVRSLPGRYSEALAGASLGVRRAERDGEAIYRVRALGLSKEEARSMCAKVKSAGGDCYVAKN